MKILILSHKFYPDFGGIEINSEMLAGSLFMAGYDVRVMTWTKQTGDKTFDYKVIRNPGTVTLSRQHIWADVILENNPCLRLSWPALIFKKPYVVVLCTWINNWSTAKSIQDKLKLLWLKKASEVIAVSNSVRFKCWPSAIVISNPYRHELFRKLPEVSVDTSFAFLGRLVSDKGADLAIKALKLIKEDTKINDDFTSKLTIIGDGPELENLKKLTTNLQLSPAVSFTGALKGEALVQSLNRHRFLLVPSTWEEPFGNVALEGMACGCIPIVSDGGGLPDAIGNAGLTFERGNVNSLFESIKKVITDTEVEEHLKANAVAHLSAHRLDYITSLYLQVIKKAFSKL